ncbi:MAG: hypothetical protein ACT4SY_01335 [Hyphomicrobiales bacterium]
MTARPPYSRGLALLAIAGLFAWQMAIRFGSDLHHDPAWYLYVAQGLLDGKELYKEFVEVNPPLAIWLTVPVPWLARLAGLDPVDVFYMVLFLLTGLALLAVRRYSGLVPGIPADRQRILLVLTAAILLFAPGESFGQREQLIALLFLPWLMIRAARANGASFHPIEATAMGVAAAAGLCFKPHSILAPIGVEAALWFLHRNWRLVLVPENLAGAAFAVAYAAAVAIFSPQFLTFIVGLGVKAYVPFYGGNVLSIAAGSLPALVSLACAGAMAGLVNARHRALPIAGLAAGAGFLLSFYAQAKGYSYQLMAAQIFAAIAAAAAFAALPGVARRTLYRDLVAAVLLAVVFVLNWRLQTYPYYYGETVFERMIDRYRPAARSIFIASTNIYPGFPLVLNRHLVWASRFPGQWLVPYVASQWQEGPLPDDTIVAYALEAAVSDLAGFRPDMVVVDFSNDQDYVPGGRFDYLAFWTKDPRFSAIWADYELRASEDGYAVYTRKDGR